MLIDPNESPWNFLPRNFKIELMENLHRKNLSELERAEIQMVLKKQLQKYTNQGYRSDLRQPRAPRARHSGTNGLIGALFDESEETVRKRLEVLKAIKENPQLHHATVEKLVRSRKSISISKAYDEISRQNKKQQILNSSSKICFPKGLNLLHGDILDEQSKIPDSCIDLILTDPPYDRKSLVLYEQLREFAAKKLKMGGCLVFYASQYYLPQIVTTFEKDSALKYLWTFAMKNSGRWARVYDRRIFVGWKLLLAYVRGSKRTCDERFLPDFILNSKAPSKVLHKWEQGFEEAEHFIRYLTYEGQIVCDPMMGTATTCIAALRWNRKFIGIEKDYDTLQTARAKISQCLAHSTSRLYVGT